MLKYYSTEILQAKLILKLKSNLLYYDEESIKSVQNTKQRKTLKHVVKRSTIGLEVDAV